MPATIEAVSEDALLLPPEERLELAHRLLESVESIPNPDVEAAWASEIARRIARYKAGETKAIPAEEVFARLRRIAVSV